VVVATNAPVEHLQESLKLEGDAFVDLWEIRMKTTPLTYCFWNGPTKTWQGKQYEGLPCQLTGDTRSTDGQSARPTLMVYNPEKIFGVFAAEGYFDLAEVIRKRVMQQHFLTNVNLFEQRVWICARPSGVTSGSLQLELRSPTDMPAWKTPRRTFSPPEYPFVSL
jgi:lambda family phage minor tail protein L